MKICSVVMAMVESNVVLMEREDGNAFAAFAA